MLCVTRPLALSAASLRLFRSFRRYSENASDLEFKYLSGAEQGIAVFNLNRPKQKNALSGALVTQIYDAVEKLSFESKARVLIVRSMVPGVFCAGADLKERATTPAKDIAKVVARLRNLMQKIHDLPIPVIAAVDGVALGGGLEMALACDLRIASSDTKLGLVETKLGIIPGAGGTQRLPRLVGPAIAKELIYTARILSGLEAKELGIVNHVVDQNDSKDAAYQRSLEIAREILPNGPVGIKMAKAAINRGVETDLNTGLNIEEACYAQVVPTKDRIEGLEAFREKRKPQYIGE